MDIFNIKWIGESTDTPPKPTKHNTVIKTKHNGWKLMDNATWDDWNMAIIFPDNVKAEYFLANFKKNMMHYSDGMLKEDYIFHIVHFKYPKSEELYADQLSMTKDWEVEIY